MPDSQPDHPPENQEPRPHLHGRRHRPRRYMPGEIYLELPELPEKNAKLSLRLSILLSSILGATLITAMLGRVLFLSWGTWDKVVDRYGTRADPLYKDSTDAMPAAVVVLAVIFLITTIYLLARLHRK
jgi:hypothetical protein